MSIIGKVKENSAFTLIEIMVVVIIIGIVVALAAPNFSKGYSRFQLRNISDDLLNVSRWGQAMAIGQGRIYALTFSIDRHAYRLMRVKEADTLDDHKDYEAVQGSLGRMHRVPSEISLESQEDTIEFYPDGTIDGATISVSSAQRKDTLSTVAVRGMMTRVSDG